MTLTPPGDEMRELVSRCLPHTQIRDEQHALGGYAVARFRSEPATFQSHDKYPTTAPPRPQIVNNTHETTENKESLPQTGTLNNRY